MTSQRPKHLAFLLALVAAALQLLLGASAAHADDTDESMYCLYNPPTYVYGREVVPGGKYCVPGP